MLVLVLLLSTNLVGCSIYGIFGKRVILHPIDKEDYIQLKAGDTYTTDRDGVFLSDFALEEIVKAKIE